MATFSGNETVNGVVNLSTVQSVSSATLYTVPTNKYAKVYVKRLFIQTNAASYFRFGQSDYTKSLIATINSTSPYVLELAMYDGEQILIVSSSGSDNFYYSITIIEFAIP